MASAARITLGRVSCESLGRVSPRSGPAHGERGGEGQSGAWAPFSLVPPRSGRFRRGSCHYFAAVLSPACFTSSPSSSMFTSSPTTGPASIILL
jgi:hypothetical protein